MSRLRVIDMPAGDEPLWARNALVGLVVPIDQDQSSNDRYLVRKEDLLRELSTKHANAAQWWSDCLCESTSSHFHFPKDKCRVVHS